MSRMPAPRPLLAAVESRPIRPGRRSQRRRWPRSSLWCKAWYGTRRSLDTRRWALTADCSVMTMQRCSSICAASYHTWSHFRIGTFPDGVKHTTFAPCLPLVGTSSAVAVSMGRSSRAEPSKSIFLAARHRWGSAPGPSLKPFRGGISAWRQIELEVRNRPTAKGDEVFTRLKVHDRPQRQSAAAQPGQMHG